MNILIIGGTRFVGPQVAQRLVEAGHYVTLFHRGETEADLSPGVRHIHGDRHDLPAFRAAFKRLAPQVVLDMVSYTEQDATDLVRAFKGLAERTVVLSSADVYRAYGCLLGLQTGTPGAIPLTEDAPLRDALYPYRAKAASGSDPAYNYEKILVERIVMSDAQLPGTVLRLPAVYGHGDFQHRLFEYLKRMDDGRPFILLEEAHARWLWTRGYVDNLADAIALAVTDGRAANRIYNIGDRDALTEAEWARAIGQAAGWKGEVIAVPKELMPGEVAADFYYEHHLAVDTSRIREELGYGEHVSRDDALKQTVEWERAHPPEKIDLRRFDYAAEDEVLERVEKERIGKAL